MYYKKIFLSVISVVLCVAFCFAAYAHPGRTDSNGGHYNHDNGTYHYHHGYPEHNHAGGVCPYESGGSSSGSSSSSGGSSSGDGMDGADIFLIVLIGFAVLAVGWLAIFFAVVSIKDKKIIEAEATIPYKSGKMTREEYILKIKELKEVKHISFDIISKMEDKKKITREEFNFIMDRKPPEEPKEDDSPRITY